MGVTTNKDIILVYGLNTRKFYIVNMDSYWDLCEYLSYKMKTLNIITLGGLSITSDDIIGIDTL